MSDEEGRSGVGEMLQESTKSVGELDSQMVTLKKKRALRRGKITRNINRVKKFISQGAEMRKRIEKEMLEIRKDFELARECHAEMYEFADESQISAMDNWEDILIKDFYDIEENVEDFLKSLSVSQPANAMSPTSEQIIEQSNSSNENLAAGVSSVELQHEGPEEIATVRTDHEAGEIAEGSELVANNDSEHTMSENLPSLSNENTGQNPEHVSAHGNKKPEPKYILSSPQPFDSWIDDLIEFKETVLPNEVSNMSVAEALYKLEASKDIPNIKLMKYDGDPLNYVEFIERFKLLIHDKPHLSDDMRIAQLKMHVTGKAERTISGLGSQGKMYATALKTIKEQFGQPSVIARAYITKLIDKPKIQNSDRQTLQELSFDVVNCVATLKQINHLADVNATDNLRKIIMRLPDHLIHKWKDVASDLRERGENPSLEHIGKFLRRRVKAEFDPDFGDINSSSSRKRDRNGIHAGQRDPKRTLKCYVCSEDHRVLECPTFSDCSVDQRSQHAKNQRLCFSCLNRGHVTRDCKSKSKCGINGCSRFHHQLLHSDPPPPTPPLSSATSALDSDSIMPVVRVKFKSANGRVREGNVLIDSGAGITVIRKDFARLLGLQGQLERIDIAVVGGERITQSNSRRVKFWISPLNGKETFPIEAHELDNTIIKVPALNRTWLKSFDHLNDIEFPHRAGPIDLILGVQYSHLHAENEVRQGMPFQPVAKRTRLGWHVIGPDSDTRDPTLSFLNFARKIDLEKFYEFETVGVRAPDCSCPAETMSGEEKKALELFEASCTRLDGRYTIGLPWKRNPADLPNNYTLAKRRLESLERSLARNQNKAKIYASAIQEYERNGWARKLTRSEIEKTSGPVYYLPHHGVYRPEKKSTPLRIVFDPACPYRGVSLNSFLYKGPCLIGGLLGVLLRFREEAVAFAGDISKMFLQILLPESDCQVHRFLWRDMKTSEEPSIYALLRVTFGDKPSPDMASYVMLKMAEEHRDTAPEASEIIERDRYVDDLIHSCPSSKDAIQRITDVEKILSTGGFRIKEWHCSSEKVREKLFKGNEIKFKSDPGPLSSNDVSIPKERFPETSQVNLDGEQGIKALGVSWNPLNDTIKFEVKLKQDKPYTKRVILSNISRLFDPLGLVSVVTIKARIGLQEIWRMKKFGWDDPLPGEMQASWERLFAEIGELETVQFVRCLQPTSAVGLPELHVFADASILAYGAAAYLVWSSTSGERVARLVSAKARVAPLRQTTIPRLELMAALLASRLAKTIYDEFKIKPSTVILWSDSMIVLAWLRSESTLLKSFVGVRVAEIQATWEPTMWRYVPTELNPADDLSRGISVREINGRWMNGPSFLRGSPVEWPAEVNRDLAEVPEVKVAKPLFALQPVTPTIIDPSRYSNWAKLCRVTAYCLRFIKNIKSHERTNGPLLPTEMESAEQYWVKSAQRQIGDWSDRYRDLAPFKKDGIIRVGGRLRHSPLTYDETHPILLPADHVISRLVVKDSHNRVLHSGRERTLCETRRRFWIVRGRNLVQKIVKDCVTCRKLRQYPYTTLMADLPPERLKVFSPPFSVTGVDLFGPFQLKYGRNKKVKAWGAVFTCATVRAIHLEIVQDLSTESFLHALRRFAANHGWPTTIISDNGTSFVGTEKELRKLYGEGRRCIEDFASSHKVRWLFNTPLSPHQGGVFESMVKQTKAVLKVIVGQQTLSWNEMATIFAEVKCLVNSRPLGYPSNDPNDLQPLTPNHFILGRATIDAPQGPFTKTKNSRKRFEYIQSLVQQFWSRFQKEYLQTLMRRTKWQRKARQFKVGDVVLVVDDNLARGKWNLTRVIEVFPGKDGVIRNVKLKTKTGEYKRSVQKCCSILEEESS